MKAVSISLVFFMLTYYCHSQKFIPKPFPDIVKENKLLPALPPTVSLAPGERRLPPEVIISPIDHMPCYVMNTKAYAMMPVLKMAVPKNSIPNAFFLPLNAPLSPAK